MYFYYQYYYYLIKYQKFLKKKEESHFNKQEEGYTKLVPENEKKRSKSGAIVLQMLKNMDLLYSPDEGFSGTTENLGQIWR